MMRGELEKITKDQLKKTLSASDPLMMNYLSSNGHFGIMRLAHSLQGKGYSCPLITV